MSTTAPALLLIPITLAVVLVVSAVAKLKAKESTASAVRLLRLPRIVQPEVVATVLPPAEIALAVAMLSPWLPLARGAALCALVLFLAYWVLIGRAMTFDPRPSCGCFGMIGDQRVTSKTLARNTLFLAGGAAFVWMTWAQSATVMTLFSEATAREWLLLLGAGYAVLTSWFLLSRPAYVKQPPRVRRRAANAAPPAHVSPETAQGDEPGDDEYVRVPIPDAILLDATRNPFSLLQLTTTQPVLLVFLTCACGSARETLSRVGAWADQIPAVRVLVVETRQFGDHGIPDVAERLYYDPASRAYQALTMPGTSSAILLGADRLVAGGPVLGDEEIGEFVEEIAATLAEAEVATSVVASAE